MKTQKFKRTVSMLLAMLMCVTTLFGMGTQQPELYERMVYGHIPFHDDPRNGVV